MSKLFNKIKPFSIVTLSGLHALIVEIVTLLLSKDNGELAIGIQLLFTFR